MTDDEILDVVAARKAGMRIDYYSHVFNRWERCCVSPCWQFNDTKYRVHPSDLPAWNRIKGERLANLHCKVEHPKVMASDLPPLPEKDLVVLPVGFVKPEGVKFFAGWSWAPELGRRWIEGRSWDGRSGVKGSRYAVKPDTEIARINGVGFGPCPSRWGWHNPEGLAPEQVGVPEYRLLCRDEVGFRDCRGADIHAWISISWGPSEYEGHVGEWTYRTAAPYGSLPPVTEHTFQECAGEKRKDDRITFYELKFYMLSNFSSFRVHYAGRDWMTSEHAYQAMKFNDLALQSEVGWQRSAHEAMKLAQSKTEHYRPDWDKVKVSIMKEICRAKLEQHSYIQRKLMETGDRELVESSPIDSFWGWGPEKNGENHLGRIWMELREEWRNCQKPKPKPTYGQDLDGNPLTPPDKDHEIIAEGTRVHPGEVTHWYLHKGTNGHPVGWSCANNFHDNQGGVHRDASGIATVASPGDGSPGNIRAYARLRYSVLHERSGIKPGDVVEITRAAEDYERGWPLLWDRTQSNAVGTKVEVLGDCGEKGFNCRLNNDLVRPFPAFVLRKAECVRVPLPVSHYNVGDAVRRMTIPNIVMMVEMIDVAAQRIYVSGQWRSRKEMKDAWERKDPDSEEWLKCWKWADESEVSK